MESGRDSNWITINRVIWINIILLTWCKFACNMSETWDCNSIFNEMSLMLWVLPSQQGSKSNARIKTNHTEQWMNRNILHALGSLSLIKSFYHHKTNSLFNLSEKDVTFTFRKTTGENKIYQYWCKTENMDKSQRTLSSNIKRPSIIGITNNIFVNITSLLNNHWILH